MAISTLSTISVVLSTALIAREHPGVEGAMTSYDHRAIGDAAAEVVEAHLRERHPDADVRVDWSRDAMMTHRVEVTTTSGPCGPGDYEAMDVQDRVLEALEAYLRAQ